MERIKIPAEQVFNLLQKGDAVFNDGYSKYYIGIADENKIYTDLDEEDGAEFTDIWEEENLSGRILITKGKVIELISSRVIETENYLLTLIF